MTEAEALLVARIAATADRGCYDCVGQLWAELSRRIPEIDRAVIERAARMRPLDGATGPGNPMDALRVYASHADT